MDRKPSDLPKWKKRLRAFGLTLLALVLILGATVGTSVLVCDRCVTAHSYDVRIDGIARPFAAVLLTDLHGKEYGPGNSELLELIREQRPDVIFSVGDMIDSAASDEDVERFLVLLTELQKIAPVYAAFGNHEEEFMERTGTDLKPLIEETGVPLLDEECVTVEIAGNRICLGGTLGHLYLFGRTAEEYYASPEHLLMERMQASGLPTIVLAHLPDTIIFEHAYQDYDIDLFLSGHTHGGVIRLPFAGGLYAPMQGWFPDEDMGYYNYGRVQLVISSGLSGHGKVPRVFNMPEVCVVRIS